MKKVVLLTIFLVPAYAHAQVYAPNEQSCEIYAGVIKSLNDNALPHLSAHTANRTIKDFHFNDPGHHLLINKNFKISDDWKNFLSLIDTAKFVDHLINCVLDTANKKPGILGNLRYRSLTLSSIVVSPNGKMAVCAYDLIHDPADVVGAVLFMEKINGEWKVANYFMMYFS